MRPCAPGRWGIVFLLASAFASAQQAPIPMAGELPGRPFAIQNKWVIGGVGDWGYLTLDAAARQLFIAHGSTVQVVDLSSGAVVGTVSGLEDARSIVLGNGDGYGYVTDGPANDVKVFDRTTFEVIGSMPTGPQPRGLALDTSSGLLVAICAAPTSEFIPQRDEGQEQHGRPAAPPRTYFPPPPNSPLSIITVMDPQSRRTMADLIFAGTLGFAEPDGDGHIFVSDESNNRIVRFDVQAIANQIEKQREEAAAHENAKQKPDSKPLKLDWSGSGAVRPPEEVVPYSIRLYGGCQKPRGIAIDRQNYRLFIACSNQQMAVLNSQSGANLATLTIGPGADAIAYDPSRSLIFTANGGGYGSLSVIQQHVTDDYAVIQNLPTLAQARTMAVDSSTGQVYLVTTLYGAKLSNPPANGIGTLKLDPVGGSFQVLVIGR